MSVWIKIAGLVLLALLVAAAIAWALGNRGYRQRMGQARAAWDDIAARAGGPAGIYDPALVAGLPEIAQRYFNHAIAPGTPLHTSVVLTMSGEFLLGDKTAPRPLAMQARQILSAPEEFVWIASMKSGAFRVDGSDGLYRTHGWTRFWMWKSLPLVQVAATPDIDRSAAVRPALEAVWAPAALLPANGAEWQQTGPDSARVTLGRSQARVTMDMTLAPDGRLTAISTQRWSDANPEKQFRWQSFGGTFERDATFAGYTIPVLAHVGNHFGTDDYLPFFNAEILSADYR